MLYRTLAPIVVLSVLAVMSVGLLDLSQSHGEHASHASHCPFMQHGEALCPMTLFDHMSVVRGMLQSSIAYVVVPVATVILFFAFTARGIPIESLTRVFERWRRRVVYSVPRHALHELYANGVLNPKLYVHVV